MHLRFRLASYKNYMSVIAFPMCFINIIYFVLQKHLQHLPDGTRAGFFVGDGAGVGKGRTIAGLILENWQHGRRKAL